MATARRSELRPLKRSSPQDPASNGGLGPLKISNPYFLHLHLSLIVDVLPRMISVLSPVLSLPKDPLSHIVGSACRCPRETLQVQVQQNCQSAFRCLRSLTLLQRIHRPHPCCLVDREDWISPELLQISIIQRLLSHHRNLLPSLDLEVVSCPGKVSSVHQATPTFPNHRVTYQTLCGERWRTERSRVCRVQWGALT